LTQREATFTSSHREGTETMVQREIQSDHRKQKRDALNHLWLEIEKVILRSAEVRLALAQYQARDSMDESPSDNIILDIAKLTQMVNTNEASPQPAAAGQQSLEEVFRKMVRDLRAHLVKSIQSNLRLIESSAKLSLENEKLRKKLDELDEKHNKALKNIEKILFNITRNPN